VSETIWRTRTRWFAAEFLVVVSGIIVALALQAWYQKRGEIRAERVYLKQLHADLVTNDSVLTRSIRTDSARILAHRFLILALSRTEPLAYDSARAWFSNGLNFFADPRPVMGTVTTLIGTGDIRMIRDPALRSRIIAYAGSMESDKEALARNVDRLTRAIDEVRVLRERHGVPAPLQDQTKADSVRIYERIVRDWPGLRSDPDLRAAVALRNNSFGQLVYYMNRMRTSAIRLNELVENAIDE
jgi:hypothetical protein